MRAVGFPVFTLHKLGKGFIVTSDKKISPGEVTPYLMFWPSGEITYENNNNGISNSRIKYAKRVIAQQDQIDFSEDIPEEKLREIGWFDIEKFIGEIDTPENLDQFSYDEGIKTGFQKSQELLQKRWFTLEDMDKAVQKGIDICSKNSDSVNGIDLDKSESDKEEYIQSLSQKSWEIEVEMEDLYDEDDNMDLISVPKLNNGKIKITRLL